MTTIYIVTDGEYSDFAIIGVFDNKELAEKCATKFNCNKDILEYELNSMEGLVNSDMNLYEVAMDFNGNSRCSALHEDFYMGRIGQAECFNGGMTTYCMAKDQVHATKIANERRVFLIDNGVLTYNLKRTRYSFNG